ncbi:MAG TPA: hypothetical protein VGB86_00980 [Methylomirabilota bacterium]|jgi:hypothetical protein
MRTSYHSVSSAQRLSSWLMAVLGLAAYVGLIYVLTLVPLQVEVPLPKWAVASIPPVTYGLLVWLWVRRPSVLRWLVGTAVLSGLHVLLAMSREPLSALLDPALAGRPLPWMLPPPLPELIGVLLLLVPLRDVLRAPVRLARERGAATRPAASPRVRVATPSRVPSAPALEGSGSLSETLFSRGAAAPEPVVTAAPVAPPPPPPLAPAPEETPRRRRAAALAQRRREAAPARTPGRSEVVLRIALDRVMGQFPPGTFLAPEDEVAASLSDPGFLRISGELVVTQLSEGVARVAWSDIADQFPAHLVGLSKAEIAEHLGDGLRLPLDEVIAQFPQELFVADTPEVDIHGLHRIPVPFHPAEESDTAHESAAVIQRDPEITPAPEIRPGPPVEEPPIATPVPAAVPSRMKTPPVAHPEPVAIELPAAPEPIRRPEPTPIEVFPAAPETDEPTVRISFSRVAPELPVEAFRSPLEQVAERMRQPGSLLIPQSLVLPQLAEGLIRVGWDVVAPQFPRNEMAVSDAEMAERLPNGIRLPLDEVIRQVPLDLFTAPGPAADVRGLEYFPAPFQPFLSDPAPEPPVELAADPVPPILTVPAPEPGLAEEAPGTVLVPVEPVPDLVLPAAPEAIVVADPMVERAMEPVEAVAAVPPVVPMVEPDPPLGLDTSVVLDEPEPVVVAPSPAVAPAYEPASPPEFARTGPSLGRAAARWADPAPSTPIPAPLVPGPTEAAEARRIVALLAPIASFDVSIQAVEGITVFAMASPTVAHETAVAVAGLALPLLMDRRPPWPVDQITLRGPETALVLTPLGGRGDRGPVLAAAAPRGGALALLEILCRRAVGDRAGRPPAPPHDLVPAGSASLASAAVPSRAAALTRGLTAFGDVTASVLRDAESEAVLYFFLPAGDDVPAVGAFAQDLHAVMRKAAGSGAVFRTAILRSGDTLLVIQPEEIGHGRSIVIVAGGSVTRPGLAYRQVERAAATLMSA